MQYEIVDANNTTHNRQVRRSIPKGKTLIAWFTLEDLWDNNDITVWIKAGQQDPYKG